jgi:hypothetical protein
MCNLKKIKKKIYLIKTGKKVHSAQSSIIMDDSKKTKQLMLQCCFQIKIN